jgi:2-octaprenyl-6-methoxyphenol hydroxylase
VWSEKDAMAARMLALDDAEFIQELRQRVGTYLGAFSLCSTRYSYPLKLIRALRLTDTRFALVGDAGHGIHPIAGQGVNLGYRDVAALRDILCDQARVGLDIGGADVLARYERTRHLDISSMSYVTDGINRLFSNALPPLRIARIAGLGAVNRFGPLKRWLMRDAMGLNGDLPEMMRAS